MKKGWFTVRHSATSSLHSLMIEKQKPELMTFMIHRVEWVAEVDGQIVGLIDIDIYTGA